MDEAFPLTFMHFCELDDIVFVQNLGLHVCVCVCVCVCVLGGGGGGSGPKSVNIASVG